MHAHLEARSGRASGGSGGAPAKGTHSIMYVQHAGHGPFQVIVTLFVNYVLIYLTVKYLLKEAGAKRG